ncbi:MAG: hypothetical protein Q7V57_10115 [Actinomycetota bacterium]|nr:hypothetical protein [Actinomycetota bacterium]
MVTPVLHRTVFAIATISLLAFTAACTDDAADTGASSADSTADTTASTVPLADGTISVSTTGPIVGQAGKALVVMVIGDTGPVASACVQIGADEFLLGPTVLTEVSGGNDPCAGSTTPMVFTPGSYNVTFGVFVPPATSAETSVEQTVQVTGPGVAVTVDGSSLSA